MQTKWDYTDLASAYLKRPDYSNKAIDDMLGLTGTKVGFFVCDIGAGVAHLTIKLAERGLKVVAVEPNEAMRMLGIRRTAAHFGNVQWVEGTGENTGQQKSAFHLVTFGSSFNVTDRHLALIECHRILESNGWFACMWNHRDLTNPLQAEIEAIIKYYLPGYQYGTRREDQTDTILRSGLFKDVIKITSNLIHAQSQDDCVEAWKSHATLYRQAGDKFDRVISDIEKMIRNYGQDPILIPYTTAIWIARVIKP